MVKIFLIALILFIGIFNQSLNLRANEEDDEEKITQSSNTNITSTQDTQNNAVKNALENNVEAAKMINADTFNASKVYLAGDTVNIKGAIYQAQWWTQANPLSGSGSGMPWIMLENNSRGGIPDMYNDNNVYGTGNNWFAIRNGVVYVAKWWTQGVDPEKKNGNGEVWGKVQNLVSNIDIKADVPEYAENITYHKGDIVYVKQGDNKTYYQLNEDVVTHVTPITARGANSLNSLNPWSLIVNDDTITKQIDDVNHRTNNISNAKQPPLAPTDFKAEPLKTTNTSVTLVWTDPDTNSSSLGNRYDVYQNGLQILDNVTSLSTTIGSLTKNTNYVFKVLTENNNGASSFSKDITVQTSNIADAEQFAKSTQNDVVFYDSTKDHYSKGDRVIDDGFIYEAKWWTNSDPSNNNGGDGVPWLKIAPFVTTAPDTPTNLNGEIKSKGIKLSWAGNENNYVQEYTVTSNSGTTDDTTDDKTFETTQKSLYISGLTPNTNHKFKVKAANTAGDSSSDWSDIFRTSSAATTSGGTKLFFAPYIDMSLNNAAELLTDNKLQESGIKAISLGFIQSNGSGGIGWSGLGGNLTNDIIQNGTPNGISIQTLVQKMQQRFDSIDVIISVGGMAGKDPAVYAKDHSQSANTLAGMFDDIIDIYKVDTLDFDVEGHAITSDDANKLRAEALFLLDNDSTYKNTEGFNDEGNRRNGLLTELEKTDYDTDITITFTLPVLNTGLVDTGINLLKTTRDAGVHIDRVNIMTMDFGAAYNNGGDMSAATIQAIQYVEDQLDDLLLTDVMIGVIPMIGQNDVRGEIFTLDDAQEVYDYVQTDDRVEMLSYWSLGRDNSPAANNTYASALHSGITGNKDFAFADAFNGP